MKHLIALFTMLLVSTYCFAATPKLDQLKSAWTTQQTHNLKSPKKDLTIVYGGEDVSRRPTLALHSTTA